MYNKSCFSKNIIAIFLNKIRAQITEGLKKKKEIKGAGRIEWNRKSLVSVQFAKKT